MSDILQKHHNEYLTQFNLFMQTIKKDYQEKLKMIEKHEKERKKNENIYLIIAERDFFKHEALRLNKLCKGKYSLTLYPQSFKLFKSKSHNI